MSEIFYISLRQMLIAIQNTDCLRISYFVIILTLKTVSVAMIDFYGSNDAPHKYVQVYRKLPKGCGRSISV